MPQHTPTEWIKFSNDQKKKLAEKVGAIKTCIYTLPAEE